MQPLASFPSPAEGVWHLGPFPLRAYAFMIILGIIVGVWLGERRWVKRGGTPGVVMDVAIWAVVFGLIGGRLYHVITDYQRYFGDGKDPLTAFQVWHGGLGIWGAVLLGGVGAWIACRRRGVSVLALGDAVAPGIALGQVIGRWGNYWNQELYGRPLKAPWALEIDPDHRPRLSDGGLDPKYADLATYHPTFLYESLWCIGVAVLVIWADRRFKLTHGRTFALYVAAYTVGRFWIEWLRIDEAHEILGLRLNDWTSLVVFAGAVAYLYWARDKTGPERLTVPGADPETEPPAKPDPLAKDAHPAEPGEEETPASAAAVAKPAEAEPDEATKPATEDEPGETAEPASDEPAETAEPAGTDEPEATDEPDEAAEPVVNEEPAGIAEPGEADESGGPAESAVNGESGGTAETVTAEPEEAAPVADAEDEQADAAAGDGGGDGDQGEKPESVKDSR